MEEDKYYTPKIEELHVGFEIQLQNIENAQWGTYEIVSGDNISELYTENIDWLRVKFLDREDIESLGWKYTGKSIDVWFVMEGDFNMGSWTSYKVTLQYGLQDHRVRVNMYDTGVEGPNSFLGVVKNKSELKKLMEMIGIEVLKP
jgi:hypothetical protein